MKLLVHEIIGTFIHGITQQRIWRIARIFCDPQSIRIVSKGEVPSTREDRDLGERIRERDGLRDFGSTGICGQLPLARYAAFGLRKAGIKRL